jgi:hypothetical protein
MRAVDSAARYNTRLTASFECQHLFLNSCSTASPPPPPPPPPSRPLQPLDEVLKSTDSTLCVQRSLISRSPHWQTRVTCPRRRRQAAVARAASRANQAPARAHQGRGAVFCAAIATLVSTVGKQALPPLGSIFAEYRPCGRVRLMFPCVAFACRRLATAPADVHMIHMCGAGLRWIWSV